MRIISRAEARKTGAMFYCTGMPCKRGHIAERFTCSANCVPCMKEKGRARYILNRNDVIAKAKAWAEANPERKAANNRAAIERNPERYKEKRRAWELNNPEKMRGYRQAFYLRTSDKKAAYSRIWFKTNPEKVAQYNAAKRLRKLNAEGSFTSADVARILADQKYKCAWCKQSVRKSFSVDHIEALTKGGTNWPRNLQILCKSCNSRKNNLDPVVFAQREGRLL